MANYKVCGEPGEFRYTWAGRDEAFICQGCVGKLMAVARAMGYPLRIISCGAVFEGEPRTCSQNVKVVADSLTAKGGES